MDVREAILNAHHSLIAGTTGSGKSVLLNSVICEGLKRDYQFWFIDLKRVELNQYKKTKNCLAYATEPETAIALLDDIIDDMDEEYDRMEAKGVKETDRPHRYLVIDELADLVSTKGVLEKIVKIGRLGRAAHIHTIGATQDPSRFTLSAQLMQNITCAVALRCKTAIESRQIIGTDGAETLPQYGKGYVSTYKGVTKVDIPLTPDEEMRDVIESHRKSQPVKKSSPTPQAKAPDNAPAPVQTVDRFVFTKHELAVMIYVCVCIIVLLVGMIANPVIFCSVLLFVGLVVCFFVACREYYRK